MHEGRLHVTPETGTTGTFVPSNTYVRGASATSSGISTALAGSQVIAWIAPGFVASMALPFGLAVPEAVTGPVCRSPLMIGVVLFGLIGFGLNVLDLYLGMRLRTRCHDVSENGERILLAYGDTRSMLTGLGVPLRATDGPVRFASLPGGGGHDHEHEPAPAPSHEEHEHPHERPNPNNAPAGA